MEMKDRNDYFKVNNAEELLQALEENEPYILIQSEFKQEFEQNTELPLTEAEIMPLELGFRGAAGIWSEIYYQIIKVFSKGNKQQQKIDSKIRKYVLKKLNENEFLLYLRQLDY